MSIDFGLIENVVEARFRIVTPMFLGGANHEADEIRPSSVKGMLRFWWRALNWSVYRSQAGATDASALKALHDEEARLFGSAAGKGTDGQGCFLMSIPLPDMAFGVSKTGSVHNNFSKKPAARYLGYGLMEAFSSAKKNTQAGQLNRDCINEAQQFVVKILFKNGFDESIKNSLIAFGLLGGLGSRYRHGLGSVALEEIRLKNAVVWSAPKAVDEYHAMLKTLLMGADDVKTAAPYSAFSADTRLDILVKASDPFSVLNGFGNNMLDYRSYGQSKNGNKLPSGAVSEKNFQDDHDWYRIKKEPDFHPRRVVFGLPHNYDKKESFHVTPELHERRASPLLFHVHQVGQQFIGVGMLLKAEFLGKNEHGQAEKINVGGKMVAAKIEWNVLTDFLDGKVKSTNQPRFPDKQRVWGKQP